MSDSDNLSSGKKDDQQCLKFETDSSSNSLDISNQITIQNFSCEDENEESAKETDENMKISDQCKDSEREQLEELDKESKKSKSENSKMQIEESEESLDYVNDLWPVDEQVPQLRIEDDVDENNTHLTEVQESNEDSLTLQQELIDENEGKDDHRINTEEHIKGQDSSSLNSKDYMQMAKEIMESTKNKSKDSQLCKPSAQNQSRSQSEEEPKLDHQKGPNLDLQDEPNLNLQEEPKLDFQDEPNLNLLGDPKLDFQEEPKLDLHDGPNLDHQEESKIDLQEGPKPDSQEEPKLDLQEEPKHIFQEKCKFDLQVKSKLELDNNDSVLLPETLNKKEELSEYKGSVSAISLNIDSSIVESISDNTLADADEMEVQSLLTLGTNKQIPESTNKIAKNYVNRNLEQDEDVEYKKSDEFEDDGGRNVDQPDNRYGVEDEIKTNKFEGGVDKNVFKNVIQGTQIEKTLEMHDTSLNECEHVETVCNTISKELVMDNVIESIQEKRLKNDVVSWESDANTSELEKEILDNKTDDENILPECQSLKEGNKFDNQGSDDVNSTSEEQINSEKVEIPSDQVVIGIKQTSIFKDNSDADSKHTAQENKEHEEQQCVALIKDYSNSGTRYCKKEYLDENEVDSDSQINRNPENLETETGIEMEMDNASEEIDLDQARSPSGGLKRENESVDKGPVKKSMKNIERVKQKLEEIIEKSRIEEDIAIAELQHMQQEKAEMLKLITAEMETVKSLLAQRKGKDMKNAA